MNYNDVKTNDLIRKLNRYSFEDRLAKCLLLSYNSIDFVKSQSDGKPFMAPWIVDGITTLCILAQTSPKFTKEIFSKEGEKDFKYIKEALFNQDPPINITYEDIDSVFNFLGNPQNVYQRNEGIILFRYSFFFHNLKKELLELTNGIDYIHYILITLVFSNLKNGKSSEEVVFKSVKFFIDFYKNTIVSLSISRDDLEKRTYELYDDFNDLKRFAYSFKYVSSYPFLINDGKWHLIAIHNLLNATTKGFMARITEKHKEASDKLGLIIEKYIYMIAEQNQYTKSIENDDELYKYKKNNLRKPDISLVIDNSLVIIESKKAWYSLKATYNEFEAIENEMNKGIESCEKSMNNYIRFKEGFYSLCGKKYSDYDNVYLIVCLENDSYWPRNKIISKLKEKYQKHEDFIENSFFITSLYELESYFLFDWSILPELERKREDYEKNKILRCPKKSKRRIKDFEGFLENNKIQMKKLQDAITKYIKNYPNE